ncbi:hypothetical protein K438DRAFT_1787533 [Mycena galopus ATCC 62051]|nr:hypothetical protein K438DRAFT_1787533 [Mycena galopus ATCC 62051]
MPPITVSLEENTAAQLLELLQSAPPSMHPVYAALRSSLSAATSSTPSGTGVSAGHRGPATSLASTVHAAEPAPPATRQRLLFDAVTPLAPKRAQSLPPIGSSSPRKFVLFPNKLPRTHPSASANCTAATKSHAPPPALAAVVEDQEMLFVPSSSEVLLRAPWSSPIFCTPSDSHIVFTGVIVCVTFLPCHIQAKSGLHIVFSGVIFCFKAAISHRNSKRMRTQETDDTVGEDELSEANEGNSSANGKKQKGKKKAVQSHHGYTTSGGGPPLTKDAGTLLTAMVGSIFTREKRAELTYKAQYFQHLGHRGVACGLHWITFIQISPESLGAVTNQSNKGHTMVATYSVNMGLGHVWCSHTSPKRKYYIIYATKGNHRKKQLPPHCSYKTQDNLATKAACYLTTEYQIIEAAIKLQ